ncbi:hypothetical protein M0804_010188 [Polistes exclamans]|nr:hypothetical protein M0804_010188 [Polistes exclamans]
MGIQIFRGFKQWSKSFSSRHKNERFLTGTHDDKRGIRDTDFAAENKSADWLIIPNQFETDVNNYQSGGKVPYRWNVLIGS